MHFVPIKRWLGEYFITEIHKQVYCFKIDASRIMFYQETAVKSFRILLYSIDGWTPLAPAHVKELEDILEKNTLPNVNRNQLVVFKYFGSREKRNTKDFKPHNLTELYTEADKIKEKMPEETSAFVSYLRELDKTEIVTPVKRLSEFLDAELLLPDPRFFGTVMSLNQRVDTERKLVANKPIGPKNAWMKMALIISIIVIIGGIIAFGYTQGWFNSLAPSFGNFGGSSSTGFTATNPNAKIDENTLLSQYPQPQNMVDAIHAHSLQCSQLPADVKKMVNVAKAGTCP